MGFFSDILLLAKAPNNCGDLAHCLFNDKYSGDTQYTDSVPMLHVVLAVRISPVTIVKYWV